ncbi:hypothetical protein RJ641_006160, partial [Dillenia turbinata]
MLLRSALTQILRPPSEHDPDHHLHYPTQSASIAVHSVSWPSRNFIRHHQHPNNNKLANVHPPILSKEEEREANFKNAWWNYIVSNQEERETGRESECCDVLVGGSCGGYGGGWICGGDGGESDSDDEFSGWDDWKEKMDLYYQRMIMENPGNALLLGNYARFLNEVLDDLERAEEFFERAILENQEDGNLLCAYAGLIWRRHKDASRAEFYFDQALKSAFND